MLNENEKEYWTQRVDALNKRINLILEDQNELNKAMQKYMTAEELELFITLFPTMGDYTYGSASLARCYTMAKELASGSMG